MVSSSASRSRSSKRSPERRNSPQPEKTEAVVDASAEGKDCKEDRRNSLKPEKKEEKVDSAAEGKDRKDDSKDAEAPGDRSDGKRPKGSGAVANRRVRGAPGTWQCPDCFRVIDNNPSSKQHHWDSVYCEASRLCNQHGGSWWEWKEKVEKDRGKKTWQLKENNLSNYVSKGQQRPPEPKVQPRSTSLSSWYKKSRYDWDYVTYRTDRERSHLRYRTRSRSPEPRRKRSRSRGRYESDRHGSRERARSCGRNRASGKARDGARKDHAEYVEVVVEARPAPASAKKEEAKKQTRIMKTEGKDKEQSSLARQKQEPSKEKCKPDNGQEEGGSSDYYSYESSSAGEDVGKGTPSVAPTDKKASMQVSAKSGAGKKPAVAPGMMPATSVPALPRTDRVAELSLLYNSFLRTAMEAVHGMESRGQK